jgi:hypothetical protein
MRKRIKVACLCYKDSFKFKERNLSLAKIYKLSSLFSCKTSVDGALML